MSLPHTLAVLMVRSLIPHFPHTIGDLNNTTHFERGCDPLGTRVRQKYLLFHSHDSLLCCVKRVYIAATHNPHTGRGGKKGKKMCSTVASVPVVVQFFGNVTLAGHGQSRKWYYHELIELQLNVFFYR